MGINQTIRAIKAIAAGAILTGCYAAGMDPAASSSNILVPSTRIAEWPVEGESRPGIWIRFSSGASSIPTTAFLENLRIVVEHDGRRQELSGAAFSALPGDLNMQQSRYMYTPASGVLFLTLHLRTQGRAYFPDTHRIELDDDCWRMLSYTVRGPSPMELPTPPPYPRTVFLTGALAPDPPLLLDVFESGNCFRNPLPPS